MAKLAKTAALIIFNDPRRFELLQRACRTARLDLDGMINAVYPLVRRGAVMLAKIRRRPSAGLLALLGRRLQRFDAERLAARARLGEELAERLPAGYRHVGGRLHRRTHWLFPVVAPDPDRLVAELRRRGVDASRGTSNLAAIAAEDGSVPPRAAAVMSRDRLPAVLSRARRGRPRPHPRCAASLVGSH